MVNNKDNKLNEEESQKVNGGGLGLTADSNTLTPGQIYEKYGESYCKYTGCKGYSKVSSARTGTGYGSSGGYYFCNIYTCAKCGRETYWPVNYPGQFLGDDRYSDDTEVPPSYDNTTKI